MHVDVLITSFMLKTCLFDLLPKDATADVEDCAPVEWARRIYENLATKLESRQRSGWYDDTEKLFDCSNCHVERGCCLKRNFTLALARQILAFLNTHSEHLSDIDYADDVDADVQPEVNCDRVIQQLDQRYVLTPITPS